jgi:hypothetical protein
MWKGLLVMKKILSLGILVAALAVITGCDDKKTSAPVTKPTPTTTPTGTGTH